jgi:hypothetical protein
MAAVAEGPREYSLDIDDAGHKEYKATWLVRHLVTEGPFAVSGAAGLPLPGDPWIFRSEIDPWAWRRPQARIRPHEQREGEPVQYSTAELTYTTRPLQRCGDQTVSDPLLEPQKVSGDFERRTEEFTFDRFLVPILNTAHEPIRGPQVEWDVYYPTIEIEQNVPLLQPELLTAMAGALNDALLWGFPARCIRFVPGKWSRNYHGMCNVYYTRRLTFAVRAVVSAITGEMESGWDRDIMDEGSKALNGRWGPDGEWRLRNINGQPPDPDNPKHFVRFHDINGNPTRCPLNGFGLPAGVEVGTGTGTGTFGTAFSAASIRVEALREGNFLLLGIPLSF